MPEWRSAGAASGEWLVGGGELGAAVRGFDWASTPLGSRSRWPESLRTLVNLVLENPLPTALLWGRELILIHNEAFRVIAGHRHARALGRSMRAVWPQAWCDPIADAVIERGETLLLEDQQFSSELQRARDDARFTLTCGPVRDGHGAVAGALVTLLETTARVSAETPPTADRDGETAVVAREREAFARTLERERARAAADLKRALAEAEDGQRQFRSLIENVYSAVALVDAGGRFTLYNARFRELFAISPDADIENVNSRDWSAWEVVDDSGRILDVDEHPVRKAALTRRPVKNRLVGVRSPGAVELRWMLVSAAPLFSEEGAIEQLICTYHEITDLRRAEAELRRERDFSAAVVDVAGALVMVVDRDGRILRFNRACEQAAGYHSSEVLGRHQSFLLPPGEEPLASGCKGQVERQWLAKDGSCRLIAWSNTVLTGPDGDVEFVVGTGLDVTEQRRMEEALRRANAQLLEADRRKNEFMAVLSHELRNPLAPIRNSVYILEHAEPGGERAGRARQVIDRQVRHMTRLVEDLLDVTRISRGKITLSRERTDFGALARRTAEDHREVFARNGIELVIDGDMAPLWVYGDPTRLAQVLGNLLNNSAKFTPHGGRTQLSVEPNARGEAVVRVKDNGAGMSPETLEHLFEPFVQAAQAIERSSGGLGLGLALVKGLVEMHGGSVSAFSPGEGRGAEFVVTLPLQTHAATSSRDADPAERGASARRILIIEDNLDAADSLREALELGDHEVTVAYSGPEGVAAARKLLPDVILCDIGLPGLDGYDVARALRADPDPRVRATFLVALSGYALQEDVARSKEAGFDRHLAKPLGIDALESLLVNHTHPPKS